MFIVASMVADAFFCDSQAYIKANYKPSVNHMFTAVNLSAFIISLTFSLVSGQLFTGVKFIL